MIANLEKFQKEWDEIQQKLMDPGVMSDRAGFIQLNRRRAYLEPILSLGTQINQAKKDLEDAKVLLQDAEMRDLAEGEIADLEPQIEKWEAEMQVLLLPPDPNDDLDIVIEVQQAAGGEEAALFAAELARAYLRFAEKLGFRTETLDWQEAEAGGLKTGSFAVKGNKAYSYFKYEAGVHRVQRIPATESQGRIHTSTCTVAIIP
ncbi:MAG TPA: PCRF domain-containing protein, partial [Candidatus Gracilibacteria bacterium]|nr:PCRF domain-containing protein [Candidatus Gracilibacteria bacterium]